MKIVLEIQRFNPEESAEATCQSYEVEADPTDRLLDVLMQVKRFQDGTLAFRLGRAPTPSGQTAELVRRQEEAIRELRASHEATHPARDGRLLEQVEELIRASEARQAKFLIFATRSRTVSLVPVRSSRLMPLPG